MDFTTLQQLSSILQDKLQNCTFADILSSLQSLSGLPVHPYEQLKFKYFGKDHQFQTINDISVPTDFNQKTNAKELTEIFNQTQQAGLSALSALEIKIKEVTDNPDPENFNRMNIENTTLIDENTIKNNIQFTEIINSISLDDINVKPVEVAQKLLSHYVELFR